MRLSKIKEKKISKLKLYLLTHNITQRELAQLLNLDASKVSWICNGRMILTEEEQKEVADVLNTTTEELF